MTDKQHWDWIKKNGIELNSFEALCLWAKKERWCTKIYCGTCGHSQFSGGLSKIGFRHSPMDDNWKEYPPEEPPEK